MPIAPFFPQTIFAWLPDTVYQVPDSANTGFNHQELLSISAK